VTLNALAPIVRPGATASAPFHFGPSSLKPKRKLDPARASDAVAHDATTNTDKTSNPLSTR
jgi:hypothetical protein